RTSPFMSVCYENVRPGSLRGGPGKRPASPDTQHLFHYMSQAFHSACYECLWIVELYTQACFSLDHFRSSDEATTATQFHHNQKHQYKADQDRDLQEDKAGGLLEESFARRSHQISKEETTAVALKPREGRELLGGHCECF
ncbi:hypothetical protein GOP47_0025099, partial [Adiantum capillus-veneris]